MVHLGDQIVFKILLDLRGLETSVIFVNIDCGCILGHHGVVVGRRHSLFLIYSLIL
jgi:hypothetical protein